MDRFSAGLAAFSFTLLSAGGATAANSAHVLFVNRQSVMNDSKLGQNIKQQIMAYEDRANADLGPEGTRLQNDMQAFKQQSASMTPDQRAKKGHALQAEETAFRQKVQDRQSMIQGGEMTARAYYLGQVAEAVHGVMVERGADVVLEKSAVLDSVSGLDITREVIQRLDRKVATFKVPLVKPPQGSMTQMLH